MNNQQQKEDSAFPLKKLPSESDRQFQMRAEVFRNAQSAGQSNQRAIMLSNIFYNMFYLGSNYPGEIEQEVIEYWPKTDETTQKDNTPRLYFKK